MKPPRWVHVGPFRVAIIRGARARRHLDVADLGCFDHDAARISVRDGLAPLTEREVVMHETLHLVNEVTGLRQKLGDKVEEDVVRRQSAVLLDAMRRNPRLVDYLMEDA